MDSPTLKAASGAGPVALLGDEDAGLRALLLELQPERQPGEAAAEDRYVVAVGRRLVVLHDLPPVPAQKSPG